MLLFVFSAQAYCPATGATLASVLDAAESALGTMNTPAFREATDVALADATCLGDSVSPATAARLHRAVGIRSFLDKDSQRVVEAFAAARAVEPDYRFPAALVPPDHPLRAAYDSATPANGGAAALPPPVAGRIEFDGTPSIARPTTRPTLALYFGGDGAPRASGYLWPADPMLSYESVKASTGVKAPSRKGPNVPLTIAAIASFAAAGTCWAVAKESHDAYFADESRPEALRIQSNTLYVVSVGTAVAGIGVGAAAVISGRW